MFEFHFNKVATFKSDVLSGLTVALALVPEAVAFAFVAGVVVEKLPMLRLKLSGLTHFGVSIPL